MWAAMNVPDISCGWKSNSKLKLERASTCHMSCCHDCYDALALIYAQQKLILFLISSIDDMPASAHVIFFSFKPIRFINICY